MSRTLVILRAMLVLALLASGSTRSDQSRSGASGPDNFTIESGPHQLWVVDNLFTGRSALMDGDSGKMLAGTQRRRATQPHAADLLTRR